MIRCITFDLDDTLWAVDPVIRYANRTMFEWLEQYAPAFTRCYQLKDLPRLRQQVLEVDPTIAHSVTAIRIAQLRHGLLQVGYAEQDAQVLSAQAFAVFIQARQQVEFFEHSREMLAALKQQEYLLGALSNGNADIHRVGLADLIDFQLKADDVGEMKPHPLMFRQMLKQTGLRPEQVIHVGDNPEHDVEGAAAEGIWTIWVNLKQQEACAAATVEVNCLSQIPDAVAEIEKQAVRRITL